MKMNKYSKGQSLLELIISVGIFVAVIASLVFFVLDSYLGNRLSQDMTKADFLAEEGLEAAKSIRDNNFSDLLAGSHGLIISSGHWIFQGIEDDLNSQLNGGKRVVVIENDPLDQNIKKITSTVTWDFTENRPEEIKLISFLTNWQKITGDWSQPKFVSSYNTTGNSDGTDLFFSDNKIYLVTANNNNGQNGSDPEFYIIDVSSPSSPALLGSLNLGATANAITVSGNYAYVASADNSQELKIINISNPNSPSFVSSYNTTGNSDGTDLFFSDNKIYLVTANNNNGQNGSDPEFYIIDVSSPSSPALLGSLNLGATANAITVSGNYAYVASADNSQELKIINISNPNSPSLAGYYNARTPENSDAISVAINGSTIYLGRVVNSGRELLILNVSNPSSSNLLGSYEADGDINDIYFDANRVFLATSNALQEFQLVNVANSANPIQISNYDLLGTANGIFYSSDNDLAYLATIRNDQELVIIGPGP